jgi:uncharacterized protein YndB with AHSA1/START domain
MMTEHTSAVARDLEVRMEINAPVDAVWRALTDPTELIRWFPLEAKIEPGAGGRIWTAWGDAHRNGEEIVIWEPNRRLKTVRRSDTFSEALHGDDAARIPITIDYQLEGKGGTTILRLVHSGFQRGTRWDEEYDGTRRGWGFELRGLRHYLERHRGTPRRAAWVRVGIDIDLVEAWSRLFGPKGLAAEGSLSGVAEGSRYALRTAEGDDLVGTVVYLGPPRDFAATVAGFNDALLRVKVDEYGGQREAHLWLSTYGVPLERVAAFEERSEQLLRSVFPDATPLFHVSCRG